jgi:hypothetical protein
VHLNLSRVETPRVFSTRNVDLVAVLPAQPTRSAKSDPEPVPRVAEPQVAAQAKPKPAQATALVVSNSDEPGSSTEVSPGPARSPSEPAALAGLATVPESVRIKYQVTSNKFPYRLNAELAWQQNGEDYDTRLEISAFGLSRVQTSRGLVTPQGLAPIRFSDKYRSEVAAHFNREKGMVTFSANSPDVALQPGAQDRLSIMIQLAAMIAAAPARFPLDTIIATQTIGPRDADTWLFTVGVQETLSLPGGNLPALKLQRNPRQEFDQRVELWLAPALGYLPARIRITEPNGDYIDQKWLVTQGPGSK